MSKYFSMLKEKSQKNTIKMKYFYLVTALFCCYITLQPLSEQIAKSIRLVCYILCACSIWKMEFVINIIKDVFDSLRKKVLLILLEVYGTVSIVGMYFLPNGITCEREYPLFLYAVLSFFWIRPIMQAFIALLITMGDDVTVAEHEIRLRIRFILIGIILLPCLLFLFAFNPAITTRDSLFCFDMSHHLWRANQIITDWHPPFYLFILSLLLRICDSVTFLVIVQCTYFAFIFVDGILFLFQCGFSKKVLGFFYLFIAFGISNIIQLVTLWKDIPYMISLMWLTILLMKFIMRHDRYKEKIGWYVQFLFAVILTCFFRQNGILPAISVIILLLIIMKFSKKIVCVSIVCLLLLITIKGPFYRSMGVVAQPQLKYFALANDIMYSYYMGGDTSEKTMDIVNRITENEPDNFTYSPYWTYYNRNEPSGYSIGEFIGIYGENTIRNPKMALMAVLARNSVIWSIMKPLGEKPGCVNILTDYHIPEQQLEYEYPYRAENFLTHPLEILCEWFTARMILYPFYWRTGIYNLLIIFMTALILCTHKKKKLMYLVPFVPILMNLAALLIASGWSDYRYFWPSMAISIFLFFYFLFISKKSIKD